MIQNKDNLDGFEARLEYFKNHPLRRIHPFKVIREWYKRKIKQNETKKSERI